MKFYLGLAASGTLRDEAVSLLELFALKPLDWSIDIFFDL